MKMTDKKLKKQAFTFLLLMGIVSLLADMTYESARSLIGPYLLFLGASASAVGFVSGLGEFIGYAVRLVFGFVVDKTKKYWLFTILGYSINLIAIPLLAVVPPNGWIWAAILIVCERLGKAVRAPAKTTLVSFAAKRVGTGKGFGFVEVLDQIGAMLGPLLLFFIMQWKESAGTYAQYQWAFASLAIPALLTLIVLAISKAIFPKAEEFELTDSDVDTSKQKLEFKKIKPILLYIIAIGLLAVGMADFPLMAFHIETNKVIDIKYITLLYMMVMGVDGLAAFIFGNLYDKKGAMTLWIAAIIGLSFAPLVFLTTNITSIVIGLILWGILLGAMESIALAYIADNVEVNYRGRILGIYYTFYGITWFIGSWVMGILYNINPKYVAIFSVIILLSAIIVLWRQIKIRKNNENIL
ncbi:MAG TPA: MFS transporter [Bacteroidales bacterium]|jgi:MFS family permease|nr:MFS transporter [Bacteroidales bacterium]HOF07789.1 MFS transporter [Bacteroidales bacterium]HOJ24130.1 MFS transporter [Bacteroidales bacterium]HON98083.1 MFS transporter [Bacteroidales bacterium]HOS20748.1 MFS transporter [Bacteroidales bacterium]